MKKSHAIQMWTKKKCDKLDELLELNNVDEMGLLDILFMEEILNQRKKDITA